MNFVVPMNVLWSILRIFFYCNLDILDTIFVVMYFDCLKMVCFGTLQMPIDHS